MHTNKLPLHRNSLFGVWEHYGNEFIVACGDCKYGIKNTRKCRKHPKRQFDSWTGLTKTIDYAECEIKNPRGTCFDWFPIKGFEYWIKKLGGPNGLSKEM